jgi:excinuclease ABC subunit C
MPRPMHAPEPSGIPESPGVYRWLDARGRALYVGKAKNLRARLKSYYDAHEPRIQMMVAASASLEWTVTVTETDALMLERTWINTLDPPYNIKLRHSGLGARIILTAGPVPRAMVSHSPKGKVEAFGPWPSGSAPAVLSALQQVTGVATCSAGVFRSAKSSGRPCLLGDIGRCVAPCVRPEGYDDAVAATRRLLSGNAAHELSVAREQMLAASKAQEYELAAFARDRAAALSTLTSKQTVVSSARHDFDVVWVEDGVALSFAKVSVSGGVIVSVDSGTAQPGLEESSLSDLALLLYDASRKCYSNTATKAVPVAGLLPVPARPRSKVAGAVVAAAKIASANASDAARRASWRMLRDVSTKTSSATELAAALGLAAPPWRIEALDIAHLAGSTPIAGVGVLEDATPKPGRHYFVPPDLGGDDLRSISWAVSRRVASSSPPPDLLVIDGGPLQLASACEALKEAGASWPVVSIAKRLEEVFLPEQEDPVVLPRASGALYLLQAARDEAHSACNTALRKKLAKTAASSEFLSLPGVGPKRARLLQDAFGTVSKMRAASYEQVAAVPGLGPVFAARFLTALGSPAASSSPTAPDLSASDPSIAAS